MATAFTNVLTAEEIAQLTADPSIVAARAQLDSRNVVYTSATLPVSVRSRLQDTLGLNLAGADTVPMRWIRGDTPAHVDVGRAVFENTYLIYMNNSPGSLVIDGASYPIEQGTAYVFNEGLKHETVGTGDEPRLLLGPMSERAFPVGTTVVIFYFPTKADADSTNFGTQYGENDEPNYTVGSPNSGTTGGITSWRISGASTGSSPLEDIYNNGQTLNSDGGSAIYYLYPAETPSEETCCKAALDLKGLDYTTRNQVIGGILALAGPQQKPVSYSDYMRMKKAISAKRST